MSKFFKDDRQVQFVVFEKMYNCLFSTNCVEIVLLLINNLHQ